MSRDDCAANGAAYVLDALEADEAAAYERHLRTCAVCRDEVATFQGVTDALPLAAPQYRVPSDLRRRVVHTVRAESRRRPGLLLGRAPALAGAVAVVLAAVVVVIANIASNGAGGTRLVPASVRGSAASAELRITGNHAELVVRRLPAPAAGRIYEVWLERRSSAPAATSALFSVTAGGAADVGIPGQLRGISHILVTQEPVGGSRVPTGPAVIVAPTS